jgi:ATP-dependent helicase/nuclease subunit A
LMTVHKAKGLEFPVVILADLTCRLARGDASRYLSIDAGLCALRIGGWSPHELHDHAAEEVMRDEAEGVRLAYVAATRARDLLVVPALGDGPWEGGWLSPLNGALYPPPGSRRTPSHAPMSPRFKSKDTVLERPDDAPATEATVAPGLHTFERDEYSVVWWDPGTGGGLELGKKPPFGVRRDDLIVKDVPKRVIADGRTMYDQWKLARADARAAGSVPSLMVTTAGDWAKSAPTAPSDEWQGNIWTGVPLDAVETTEALGDPGDRHLAGGPAFGLLVHEMLAQLPLDADRARVEAAAGQQARILGLGIEVMQEATATVIRVLAHDTMRRASQAERRGECRRETPITYTLSDGTMVEGVVDLAFREVDHWVVVDFKTDREISEQGGERYRRQVAVYCAAIARATGEPAVGRILRI